MKNIHVIPTDKPSRLHLESNGLKLSRLQYTLVTQHIYITSDEALPYDNSIFDSGAFYHRDPLGDVHIITKHTFKPNPHFCRRIILTTDQDLIKDGVQAIDDEFLEWFVKNPSCESVEVAKLKCTGQCWKFIESDYEETCLSGCEKIEYKIIIPKEDWLLNNPQCKQIESCSKSLSKKCICPKEEPKQETLEEAAENYSNELLESKTIQPHEKTWIKSMFIYIAKWQADRMYSEEEVLKLWHWLNDGFIIRKSLPTREELIGYFEQFKKK
jgi:hypothetical protein